MKKIITLLFLSLSLLSYTALTWAEQLVYAPDKKITVMQDKFSNVWFKAENKKWVLASNTVPKFNSIIYGQGKFEAVGDSNVIWYSENGEKWELAKGMYGNGNLHAIISISSGNPKIDGFVAVGTYQTGGNGGVWTSRDGINWTLSVGADWARWINLSSVAFDGKSRIVGVGKRGQYMYSKDGGKTIHSRSLGGLADFHDITYANGRFVAVAGWSTIYISKNGKQWTPITKIQGLNENVSLNKVIYAKDQGLFVIVGDANSAGATVLISRSGKSWAKIQTDRLYKLNLDSVVANKWGIFTASYREGFSSGLFTLFQLDLLHERLALMMDTFAGAQSLYSVNNELSYIKTNIECDSHFYSANIALYTLQHSEYQPFLKWKMEDDVITTTSNLPPYRDVCHKREGII